MGPGNSIYLLTKVKQNQSMIKVISTKHVLGIWGVLGSTETKVENATQHLFLQGSYNQLWSQTQRLTITWRWPRYYNRNTCKALWEPTINHASRKSHGKIRKILQEAIFISQAWSKNGILGWRIKLTISSPDSLLKYMIQVKIGSLKWNTPFVKCDETKRAR